MKKIILAIMALGAMSSAPMVAYHSKASRVIWNNGIDLAQASLLLCLGNGIFTDKARLSGALGSIMSNKTFRILTMVNMGRALYYASIA